jgi:DNA (cytosine-5)-methyltransferase 1
MSQSSCDIKIGSLFDGIGGAPLSAVLLGADPIWASEIDEKPIAITKKHFPNMKHYGDITQINGADLEPVDVIVGGSPCTDLSVAGKRTGLAGERSGLFLDQIRIAKEMLNATSGQYPKYIIWENVPGAFSSNGGDDFQVVVEEFAHLCDPSLFVPRPSKWEKAGAIVGDHWSLAWRVVDAQYFGVPQRRRRIYALLSLGDQSAPEILFESESVSGHPAQGRTPWSHITRNAKTRLRATGTLAVRTAQTGANGIGVAEEVSHTLDCTNSQAIVAGFNGHKSITGSIQYQEEVSPTMETKMPPNVVTLHPTLKCILPKRTSCTGCWAKPVCDKHRIPDLYLFENHPHDCRVTGPCDLSPSATSRWGTGGNNVPLVMAHGQGKAEVNSNICPTINCNHEQPILATDTVRRLTPLECERLQGFPDGWTATTDDGKEIADSHRYKALGNSFAIPCALFVLEGCVNALREKQK